VTRAHILRVEEPEHRDIWLYINSPAGDHRALAIYDTAVSQAATRHPMHRFRRPAQPRCVARGRRASDFALPNSRVLIHTPEVGGLGGQARDIEINAKEILRMRELLDQILATNQRPAPRESLPGTTAETSEELRAGEVVRYTRENQSPRAVRTSSLSRAKEVTA